MKVIYGGLLFACVVYGFTFAEYQYWERICDVANETHLSYFKMDNVQLFSQCAVLCAQNELCKSFEVKGRKNDEFQCGLMDFIVYECWPSPAEIFYMVRIHSKV